MNPGAGPPASPTRANPVPVRGRHLTCGAASRQRISRLLGLDRQPVVHSVVSVVWAAQRLEVVLAREGEAPVHLVLEAATPGAPWLVAGPQVRLWSRQKTVPSELLSRLQRVTARKLASLPFVDLERLVALDPDVVETRPAGPSTSTGEPVAYDGISIPSEAIHALTAPEFYADFFAASEFRRAGCDIVDVQSGHELVSHADVECSYCAVCVPSPRAALLRLPVYESVRNIGKAPADRGTFDESEDPAKLCSSDITEQDVIFGARGKVEQVLRFADRSRTKSKLLFVGACLPDVIGEDQEAAVKEYGASTETPVYVVPPSPRSWEWLARDLLAVRRKAISGKGEADPHAVNLIGFAQNAGTRELEQLLSALGISVCARVLPALEMDAVARIPRASLNVYLPNAHWEKAYTHLLDDDGRAHLVLDAPYGLRSTRRWLQRIAEALGVDGDVTAVVQSRFEPLQERWNHLREGARGARLGLAVSSTDVDTLLDARFSWGIPLAPVIEEMGFGLDLFVGGPHASAAADTFRARTSLDPSSFVLHEFDGLGGLLSSLERSTCGAVFSNYVFDWRLVRSGKAPFSTLEFEMGLRGAVATLERLLTLARLPLFRAGGRFLRRGMPDGGADEPRR
jgi:hypothetical protein